MFWLGDLNYRITTSEAIGTEMVKKLADNFQLTKLFLLDQVRLDLVPLKGEGFYSVHTQLRVWGNDLPGPK